MRLFFNIQIDCESTQHSMQNPALGERAIRGLGDVLAETCQKASFLVIPTDLQAHADIYRDLEAQDHEIGLHCHPADQGYGEFLGTHDFDEQTRIISEGRDAFSQIMGRLPECFTPGYASANDHTFPVLEALGLKHGFVSIPTRNLPQCACVWGSSPLAPRYPHRSNRCLNGDVDFVDVPVTVDTASRMWGGAHPQDLRIELVDAKNHWYTIDKNIRRLVTAGESIAVKHIKALTHNIFEYGDPHDFRRETLLGVISTVNDICEREGMELVPATTADIAAEHRRLVSRPKAGQALELDTSGRGQQEGSGE